MMRMLAIALLAAAPGMAGAQSEKVDMVAVSPIPGVSVVVAKFASRNPVADAVGAYAFVEARSVAGAPVPASLSVKLSSQPEKADRAAIMLLAASPAGVLAAEKVVFIKKAGIACAPIEWFADNGLTTVPGAIITFPPKDICFQNG